jgi:hypothetical protein
VKVVLFTHLLVNLLTLVRSGVGQSASYLLEMLCLMLQLHMLLVHLLLLWGQMLREQ